MEGKLLLTVDEAAQRLGIGRSHTYIYVLRGQIPSVKREEGKGGRKFGYFRARESLAHQRARGREKHEGGVAGGGR
jgi:excisionase family DNA binding protein